MFAPCFHVQFFDVGQAHTTVAATALHQLFVCPVARRGDGVGGYAQLPQRAHIQFDWLGCRKELAEYAVAGQSTHEEEREPGDEPGKSLRYEQKDIHAVPLLDLYG